MPEATDSSPAAEPTVAPETPIEELAAAMPEAPAAPPKAKKRGQSNRSIKYICSRCQREVGRANLVVQRVQYLEIGVSGKLLKTRTTGWVCRDVEDACLDKDPHWTADRYRGTPGLADTEVPTEVTDPVPPATDPEP